MQTQLYKLTRRYLPALLLACVVVTTIAHHLTTPLPESLSVTYLLAFDILLILLTLPLVYHCTRALGTELGLLFFFTSAAFMGCQESLWVFLGKLGILGETYTFTTGLLWFLDLPVNVCLGWFAWNYVGYFLIKRVFPTASPIKVALLNGLLAVSLDLWMDPTTVNLHLVSDLPNFWNWAKTNAPTIFTVPVYNFWGWIVAVGTFTFIYDSSWGQKDSVEQRKQSIAAYFFKLVAGWVLIFVAVKLPQLVLETAIPSYDLCPLLFEPGNQPTLLTWALLAIVPALMLACVALYVRRAKRDRRTRRDGWLLFTYFSLILINLGMAYALQLAFPKTALILLVLFPTCFPLGLVIRYLTAAGD